MTDTTQQARVIAGITAALVHHGADAIGDGTAEDAAREWMDAGFDDVEEIDDWLRARCFSASAARDMENRGITPAQAALRTDAGDDGKVETIGHKLSRGELSYEEARRIINNEFWNS